MPNGRDILESIDRRLGALRRDAEALDEQFRRAGDELAATRRAELAVFARLARLRMNEIATGEMLRCLDDTDRQVAEIMEVRRAAEASLAVALASAESALEAAEGERARQRSAVDAAATSAEAAALQAKAQLESDAEYGSTLAAAREAEAIAEHAEVKAVSAEQDRIAKARPYDADPVFAYLWRRNYGTPEYRSSGLIRTLDAAVARASGYERMRRDYWLLHEIPRRLAEHSRRMRAKANESLEAARALEAQAAQAAGVPSTQQALADARRRLAEIDAAVDEHERAVDAAIEKRARFAAGEDEHSTRCTELLRGALERADMHELRKRAARTATQEDDRLLEELEHLEQESGHRQQESIRLRRLHQAYRERTLGLEECRRRFKQSGFDDVHATFDNGPLIDTLLERFVAGSIGTDELWQGIARQLRSRSGSGARVATDAAVR